MKKKSLVLFNMHSGKGAIKYRLVQLVDGLNKLGYEVIAYSTQKPGDAENLVMEYADELELVVCAGGDGTVSETIMGIHKCNKQIPMAFIPCGSTNDYAATLKVPKNISKLTELIEKESFRSLDIGTFNDKCFDYVAAFGLLTDIAYTTDQKLKNMIGYGAYVLEVTKRILKIPVLDISVETESGIRFSEGWFYGMVTNSNQVGGLKNITGPRVELDDGMFEVTLVRATRNPIEFIEVLGSIATGADSRFVERFKAKRITFRSKEEIAWTIDGEPGGNHKEVVIENIQQAIKIAAPKKRDRLKLISKIGTETKKD